MGERSRETGVDDTLDDGFESLLVGELGDELLDELEQREPADDKARLAAKRRRAEQRLEALRLREELGDYDFDFDDDF
ncbi:MAG: hypothetical protein V2I45_05265 [Halieaceae bacterium]|jgi:hypothetical protein|nr:hypothetical protein [Halieaceae bacterium]